MSSRSASASDFCTRYCPSRERNIHPGILSLSRTSCLVAGPIAGAILTRQHGSYDGMIIWTGVTLIVGALLIGAVKLQINHAPFAKV